MRFKINGQFARAGLVECLGPAEGFVEDAHLVLRKVWRAGDGAKFAMIMRGARGADAVADLWGDGKHHCRNAGILDGTRDDA